MLAEKYGRLGFLGMLPPEFAQADGALHMHALWL